MKTKNNEATATFGQNLQYIPDWNQVELAAITTGLNEIPVIGGILAGIVSALWPSPTVDVWAEIKQQVEALINEKIKEEVYTEVQNALGSADQQSGLMGVMDIYLSAANDFNNKKITEK